MDICVKYAEVCAISVSDGHYTESGNSSVSDEEKGRRAHETRVSYLRRRETHPCNAHLVSQEKGDTRYGGTSCISGTHISFLLNMRNKQYLQIILHGMPLAPTRSMPVGTHTQTYVCQRARTGLAQEAPRGAQAV
jgi:hypothetical protein